MNSRAHILLLLLLALPMFASCAANATQDRLEAPNSGSRPRPIVVGATARGCPELSAGAATNEPAAANGANATGTVYDCGALTVEHVDRLKVPHNAVIERVDDTDLVVMHVRRSLSLAEASGDGKSQPHPTRTNMGVAWHLQGRTVQLGTYGEFDWGFRRGAEISLHIEVPTRLTLSRSAALSGPGSIASPGHVEPPLRHEWWDAPTFPAMNWHTVMTRPDPAGPERPRAFWGHPPLMGPGRSPRVLDGPPPNARADTREVHRDCTTQFEREGKPPSSGVIRVSADFHPTSEADGVVIEHNYTGVPELAECIKTKLDAAWFRDKTPRDAELDIWFWFE